MIEKRLHLSFWILMAVWLPTLRLDAERLAVHTYNVADGLAGDQVTTITQDRQGFLWIGTRTGLSRFDGVGFRSFDTTDGLPDAGVYAMLESSDGTLWFGTGAGLVRMRDERTTDGSAFEPVDGVAGGVAALVEDDEDRIWASSAGSFYRYDPPHGGPLVEVKTGIPWRPDLSRSISALIADGEGGLWLGANLGLYHLPYLPEDEIFRLFEDSRGNLWIGAFDDTRLLRWERATDTLYHYSADGVSRYRPVGDTHRDPPAVLIDRVTVDGADLRVPLRGMRSIPRIELPSRTGMVDIGIATPVWRRWWFPTTVIASIAIAGWLVQRLRLQRLEEMHRIRSRIAADRHDEMGLSLARVSILAEVAGRAARDSSSKLPPWMAYPWHPRRVEISS